MAAEFAEAVTQTAVAAGRDDTLPMLTGIRVEIEGEKLTLAATDRFRLAVRELSWTPDKPDMSTAVLVPARTLADAAKSLGGPSEVTVALGEGCSGWQAGGRRTTVRLLDVEFVKYRSLLPSEHTTTVDVPGRRARRGDQAGRPGHRPRPSPADAGHRRVADV